MIEPNSTSSKGKAKRGKRAGSKPSGQSRSITRHPLFPAIVALWFAVLLGFGSFALSTSLIERLVLASHIDALVPAAAPPLGVTARLSLALLFGLVGAAIGYTVAQRMGTAGDKPAPQVFKVADVDLDAPFAMAMPAPVAAPVPAPAPTERLAELIAEAITPPAAVPADAIVQDVWVEAPLESAPAIAIDGPVMAPKIVEIEAQPIPVIVEQPAPPVRTAAQRIAAADLAELSHVELVERLAIALQRRQDRLEDEVAAPSEPANPVLHFPDLADRRGGREPSSVTPLRPAPQETERALREALTALQRMSGTA